jgi:hypothetical protein
MKSPHPSSSPDSCKIRSCAVGAGQVCKSGLQRRAVSSRLFSRIFAMKAVPAAEVRSVLFRNFSVRSRCCFQAVLSGRMVRPGVSGLVLSFRACYNALGGAALHLPCREIAPLRHEKGREWQNLNDGVLHRRHRSHRQSTWRPFGRGLATEVDCIRTPKRASPSRSAFRRGLFGNGSRSGASQRGRRGCYWRCSNETPPSSGR